MANSVRRRIGLRVALVLTLGFAASAQAQRAPRAGAEFNDCNGAAWCPRMVTIPAGRFVMGSPDDEVGRQANEGPQREVSVRRFAAGKFEVTWDQWQACVDGGGCSSAPVIRDAGFGRGTRPVINVSWTNAQNYVTWLSRETGETYRLLTEAEWEYAARAGATTRHAWGDEPSHEHANYGTDGCCDGAALGRDQWLGSGPVGSFPANAFGLHDMHGNVWEWVQDCLSETYEGAAADASANEANCETRVFRGGSWSSYPRALRAAVRNSAVPNDRVDSVGFRVARTLS